MYLLFGTCVFLACLAAVISAAYRTNKNAFAELNHVMEEQVKLSNELALCKEKLAAEEIRADWFKSGYEKVGFELIEASRQIANQDAELKTANMHLELVSAKLKEATGTDLFDWELLHEVHSLHNE